MATRTLLLCSGGHCRKALRKRGDVHEALENLPVEITRVGCQKICRGPVVGVQIHDEWQWFERMSSKKALQALATFVADSEHGEGTEMGKPLRKRRNHKRTGRLRT
jgi:hypothetical protein